MKLILLLIFIVSAMGCASSNVTKKAPADGVFGVVERTCIGDDSQKTFCESIQLVELVKGTFYKVKRSETALVVWYGEREELSYNMHNLGKITQKTPLNISVVHDPEYVEEFAIDAKGAASYIFGNPNSPSILVLRAFSDSDLLGFARAYPED